MFTHIEDRETVYAWFTFSHWLVYANSAANPIIYNFLSGKFREEFKAAFSCCCLGVNPRQDDRLTRGRTSTESRKSLTTQISNFENVSKLSEHVVLTSISTLPAANGSGPLQNW
uniref:Uncharacterized protein n=2 Tax=Ornithorhynchus anatinus TaxID=9258 RepID=A0A6I8N0S0_ORNAN